MDPENKLELTEVQIVALKNYLPRLIKLADGFHDDLRPTYNMSKQLYQGMSSDLYHFLTNNLMSAIEGTAPYLRKEKIEQPQVDFSVLNAIVKEEVNYRLQAEVEKRVKLRVAEETERIKTEFVNIISQMIEDDVLVPTGRWSENIAV